MFHGTITKELTNHEEWSHYNENIIEDKKDFVFVKYNGLHLKSLDNLQPCISLRVCICSNNFITDIQPLQSCIKLIKLDLHGNQIKILPDRKFWTILKNLKLLYLHDNGFSKLKSICVLSSCPSLVALTMFDCPVSLKKGYRHVLVNSIWPLKALDHHVISDEEIIQNWHLPERFKTFNHRLFFNICPALRKNRPPVDFKESPEYRKYISSLARELKTKDIDGKSKTSRHPIRKGQKESRDETDDEELDTKFRVSAFRVPLYSPCSLKYGTMLKKIKQDYVPDYLQPLPVPQPKPIIKRESLQEKNRKNSFLATQRAGMKLQTLVDIDEYYSKRNSGEQDTGKKIVVAMAQVAQERIRLNIKESLSRKKYLIQKQVEKDHERTQKDLQRVWNERLNYIENLREQRSRCLAEKKRIAADYALVQAISNERTILLKGIFKVDRMKENMIKLKEKHQAVLQKRRTEKYNHDLMKHMKNLRAEEIHRRHWEEKFVIDTLLFQKTCERLQEAKAKVEYVKETFPCRPSKKVAQ